MVRSVLQPTFPLFFRGMFLYTMYHQPPFQPKRLVANDSLHEQAGVVRLSLAKEYHAMEMKQNSLQQGIEAAQRGDRERAYQLIRQAILEDSQHAPAWYYMSFLLDDIERQREYLEWALTLEPNYAAAQEALDQLRVRQVLASARSIVAPEYRPAPRKIGDYLVDQGLISAAQRDEALAELSKIEPHTKRRTLEDS